MRASWFIAAGSLLFAGCASLSTVPLTSLLPPSGANADVHSQTSVRLEEANFRVVKTNLVGHCKGFALVGLITIVPAEYAKALDRLYAQAQLQSGKAQTLAHLTVERSSLFLILFSVPKVSVRADLVEFVPVRSEETDARHHCDQKIRPRVRVNRQASDQPFRRTRRQEAK